MSSQASHHHAGKDERQHYIDALRVFAVVVLIVFHTAMLFNSLPFYLKNADISYALTVFVNDPIAVWHMPLFMLLAGASTWYAFRKRSSFEYAAERIKRILLPLLFGVIFIIPPQLYWERAYNHQFAGTFFQFYPMFWTTGVYPQGNFSYHHLWFLAYLFVFVLLTVPLFRYLHSEHGRGLMERLARRLSKPVLLMLVVPLPIALIDMLLRPIFPTTRNIVNDWANFVLYLAFFVVGFVLVSDGRITRTLARLWPMALAWGLVFMVTQAVVDMAGLWLAAPPALQSALERIFAVAAVYNTWFWLLALMGFGARFLNRESAFLHYAREIALPFYILHQTVILGIAFYLLPLEMSLEAKFALIMFGSLVLTAALCEVVKLFNVTRFMFGMRPKHVHEQEAEVQLRQKTT